MPFPPERAGRRDRALLARAEHRISTFRRGLRLTWDASPRLFVEVGLLTVSTALMSPSMLLLAKWLVDRIVAGATVQSVLGLIAALGCAERRTRRWPHEP